MSSRSQTAIPGALLASCITASAHLHNGAAHNSISLYDGPGNAEQKQDTSVQEERESIKVIDDL